MKTSISAIPSAYWLPEPSTEVAEQVKLKAKPVQTELEARPGEVGRRAADSRNGWLRALLYTFYAGPSPISVSYAFQSLDELLSNEAPGKRVK